MQAPIGHVTSAQRIIMKPSKGLATTESVRPTIKLISAHSLNTRHSRPRPWVAGTLLLPSSPPSFLLLLAAIIFAAFTSSSSFLVHAAAITMASDVQTEEEETTSAWSGGSSRGVQEDKLQDEDELTTTSLSRCVDRTVLKLREENRALEAENSVLKGERDAYAAHVESALDLRARLDKWEPKKWMSAAAARFATAGTSSATQANVDLSTTLRLPTFEERHLVSVGSGMVASSSGDVARVGGRRLVGSCPTFLYADHATLAASNGWNLLSASCTLGTTIFLYGAGKRMKIKKDPSAEGVVEVDRQATSENKGRHSYVGSGAVLEVEGLTLTGGYEDVRFLFFFFYSSSSE